MRPSCCALLDLLPAAVLMAHDVGCKHVSVNRAAAQMLGVGSDANVSPHIADDNHAFRIRCKGKPICAEDAPIQIAASSGRELRDMEMEILRSDGTIFDIFRMRCPAARRERHDRGRDRDPHGHHRAPSQRARAGRSTAQFGAGLGRRRGADRKRLAQRLHDGFQQFLSAARLKAAIVRRKMEGDSCQALLQVERMIEQAIEESRAHHGA